MGSKVDASLLPTESENPLYRTVDTSECKYPIYIPDRGLCLSHSEADFVYISWFCLCWRCTKVGTSGDPDVVLSHQAFWGASDLILLYYWGGLRSVVPMGGGPCSAVL